MINRRKKNGFTIIELAIVLVVLGLLIGGIIAGRRVSDSAKIQAVAAEARNYKIAISQFLDVYNSLPGDIPTDRIAGDLGSYSDYNTVDAAYLGDGCIGCSGVQGTTPANTAAEVANAWRQLAASGFISRGILSGQSTDKVISTIAGSMGKILPKSRFSPSTSWYLVTSSEASPYETSNAGGAWKSGSLKLLLVGADNQATPQTEKANSMSSSMASMLDSKFDDGLPNSGNIIGGKSGGTGWETSCNTATLTNTVPSANSVYNSGVNLKLTNGCIMAFLVPFTKD